MTCSTCAHLQGQVRRAATYEMLRLFCIALIEHKMACHLHGYQRLPWEKWPVLSPTLEAIKERNN
jgi:hypothetical protein